MLNKTIKLKNQNGSMIRKIGLLYLRESHRTDGMKNHINQMFRQGRSNYL